MINQNQQSSSIVESSAAESDSSYHDNGSSRLYWQLNRESLIYGKDDLGIDYIQLHVNDNTDLSKLTEKELRRLISAKRNPLLGSVPSIFKFSHDIRPNDVLFSFNYSNSVALIGVAKSGYLHSLLIEEYRATPLYHFIRVDWRIKRTLDLPVDIRKKNIISTLSSPHWDRIKEELLKSYPGDIELQNALKLPEERPIQSQDDERLNLPNELTLSQKAAERTKNIIFYGPPGTGKTWMVENFSTYLLLQKNASNRDANLYWHALSLEDAVVDAQSQPNGSKDIPSNIEDIRREVRGPIPHNSGKITIWVIQPLHDRTHDHWANFFSTPHAEGWNSAPQIFLEEAQSGDFILIHYKENDLHHLGIVAVKMDSERATIQLAKIGMIPLPRLWDERLTNFHVVNSYGGANMYRLSEDQAQDIWRQFKKAGYSVFHPGDSKRVFIPAQNYYSIVTFHQSFSYEDLVEGLRPQARENGQVEYIIEDGVFKKFSKRAEKYWRELGNDAPQFVFVIDEINRANIAKVFGELISLIEDDKRLGKKNELRVTLPYSKKSFGIPPNLYIFGTMNTVDRSLTVIDTALRRRFAFIEIAPDSTKLKMIGDLSLGKLLDKINLRLQIALGNDYQIGHSYFINLKDSDDVEGLLFTWNQYIVPLLQEYLHGDIQRLYAFLGEEFVERTDIDDGAKRGLGSFHHSEEYNYRVKALEADTLLEALKKFVA